MAIVGRMALIALVMVVFTAVQSVERTEAVYDTSVVEFTTPSGHQVDKMGWLEDSEEEFLDEPTRRMMAVRKTYVTYGALNRNRSPCPARTAGRSYYNPNCRATGAVTPYRRGCTAITRCARG